MQVRTIGFYDNGTGQHQSNTVYDRKGIIPSLTTITGGGTQQIKVIKKYEKETDISRIVKHTRV